MDNRERNEKGEGSAADIDRRDFLKFCSALPWPLPCAVVWFKSRRRSHGGEPPPVLWLHFAELRMHRSDA